MVPAKFPMKTTDVCIILQAGRQANIFVDISLAVVLKELQLIISEKVSSRMMLYVVKCVFMSLSTHWWAYSTLYKHLSFILYLLYEITRYYFFLHLSCPGLIKLYQAVLEGTNTACRSLISNKYWAFISKQTLEVITLSLSSTRCFYCLSSSPLSCWFLTLWWQRWRSVSWL